jgi:hypothetical protein
MSGAIVTPIEIGNETYTLTFKFGTMRIAEIEIGKPIVSLTTSDFGFDVISSLFWAVLQPKHNMTRDASDNLVDVAGVASVGTWVSDGLAAYFKSDVVDGGNAKAKKKPQTS